MAHRNWLDRLQLEGETGAVFREYLHAIDEISGRIERLESEIHEVATQSTHAPVIHALQALRGVQEVTEVGQFSRFRHPAQLMAYAGLVPPEYSSGSSRWQGGITKTGNAHLRRIAIEAAWAYRHKPSLKVTLRKRQEGQSAQVRDISWRAQVRLHKKYIGLIMRGKGGGVATAAVARELLGSAWALPARSRTNCGRPTHQLPDPRHHVLTGQS